MIDPMLQWWLDSLQLTKQDENILWNLQREEDPNTNGDFQDIINRFFSSLPFCNLKDYKLGFDTCATNIIDNLFKDYVDDDTLVITSGSEHKSVVANLEKCKHILKICGNGQMFPVGNISEKLNGFKKVFVYIIGTSNGDLQVTPNRLYRDLKTILINKDIEHKIVIDACQELFLTIRDYSLFDFIIGTAHAVINHYNMGIIISKNEQRGIKAVNWGNEFLKGIDILVKRKAQLYSFGNLMMSYYDRILYNDRFIIMRNTPYIFAFEDKLGKMPKTDDASDTASAVFRGPHAMCIPGYLEERVSKTNRGLDFILDEIY